jgi:hypothetical protein
MIYTEGSRIMLAQVFPAQLSNQLTSTHTLWLEVEEGERTEHTNTAQHKSETLKECCSEVLFIALA